MNAMATRAAIFDLDRTLLGDSSGLLLTEALVDIGLMSERDRKLAEIGRSAYRYFGETWIGMQLTRRSISRIAGWSHADLREAARRSVDRMDSAVYGEARTLIERHRREGHLVCIATSTGRDIVEPLADRLGVDRLIATEYEIGDEGLLTGGFIGKWLWGPDKADAVREFADREGVDLAQSYAYSDSYYDRHLLDAVGFPRSVNPDPMLRAYATAKGWPVLEFKGEPGPPSTGVEPYDVVKLLANPLLSPINVRIQDADRIPARGPCIVAANHRAYLDPLVLAAVASRRGRKLRYLGKKEVFDAPLLGQFARLTGQIRVDRGTGSARPLEEAEDALARGEAIGIFPQGTIPRGRAFFEPRLHGRTGVARLAVAAGVAVIPVGMWGTEKIWPRHSRVPRLSRLATRTPVYARVGEPLYLKAEPGREDDKDVLAELTQQVMDAISALLPEEIRTPPEPTFEQLKAATPPNVKLEDYV
jgi:putative phosphoserine phosphatase/1-acylglycerol-3-phosphate O-acyltransferase